MEKETSVNGIQVHKRTREEIEQLDMSIAEIWKKKPLYYKAIKRVFDVVAASLGVIILSPVFIITAIAIAIEDGAPVLFQQPRTGKDMKSFKFYKFRSMYKDAPERLQEVMKDNEQEGPAFKMKNDPRITKVGNFIRKYSIDELPQFINVIKGDMSIVGPRPILDFQMEAADVYDQQRMVVRPGLTCTWQINGRSSIPWEQWVEMDLQYIRDMSLWTDFKIIIGTIPAVFRGEGAY